MPFTVALASVISLVFKITVIVCLMFSLDFFNAFIATTTSLSVAASLLLATAVDILLSAFAILPDMLFAVLLLPISFDCIPDFFSFALLVFTSSHIVGTYDVMLIMLLPLPLLVLLSLLVVVVVFDDCCFLAALAVFTVLDDFVDVSVFFAVAVLAVAFFSTVAVGVYE